MKYDKKLIYFFLVLTVSACTGSSSRHTFGSGYYGKNEVVKNPKSKEIEQSIDPIKSNTFYTEQEIIRDSISNINDQKRVDEVVSVYEDVLSEGKINSTEKIDSFKNALQNVGDLTLPFAGKKTPKTHLKKSIIDDALIAVLVVIIIYVLAILLIIFLFYLLIKAINDSVDNASSESGCYVATMTYGSYDHPKVMILRNFRDDFLAKRQWGKAFIQWYYRHSPSFVDVYRNNRFVNSYLRMHLNLFIFIISPFYKK